MVGDGSRGPAFELKHGVPFLAIKSDKTTIFCRNLHLRGI